MSSKLDIWKALSKTDPAHTKTFQRAGGFRGTAIKPIWIVHRLTEQFGPAGVGWGMGEPQFQIVPAGEETLVFCHVECWHTKPENTFYGVGGDKVLAKRRNGTFADDEAFKKAYTDAVNNAFKFIGVAADVHMGLFDDSKYVESVTAEFAEWPDGPFKAKTHAQKFWREEAPGLIKDCADRASLDELVKGWTPGINQTLAYPPLAFWINGGGEETGEDWPGIKGLVQARRAKLEDNDTLVLLAEIEKLETQKALATWENTNLERLDALPEDAATEVSHAIKLAKERIEMVDNVRAG